jgi:hypothetical protein
MLHPVKREFTYVPNARINVNRSRIDFFLIDTGMAEDLADCKISSAVASTSFDHKKINLTLGKLGKSKNFNKIDEKLIKHTGINTLTKTKILENYIIHADPESVPRYISTNILIECGRIEPLVRQGITDPDPENFILAAEIFETLPDLEFFENLPQSCSDDFLFESLVSAVRLVTLSAQHSYHLQQNKIIKEMTARLNGLKENYTRNAAEIFRIESQLSEINETNLREELKNYKVFDRLNNEKITLIFMKMAKSQTKSPEIDRIKNDTGTLLTEPVEIENYVSGFYERLYSKPENEAPVTADRIINFLGNISNSDQILNSKLNEEERLDLDRPLNITEFDKAIASCKKKSAPGTDGISNNFIKTFWPYFRTPLLNPLIPRRAFMHG